MLFHGSTTWPGPGSVCGVVIDVAGRNVAAAWWWCTASQVQEHERQPQIQESDPCKERGIDTDGAQSRLDEPQASRDIEHHTARE